MMVVMVPQENHAAVEEGTFIVVAFSQVSDAGCAIPGAKTEF